MVAYVPLTASVVINSTLFGVPIANVLHARLVIGTEWTLADLDALADAARVAFVGDLMVFLSTDLIHVSVVATDISAAGGLQAINTVSAGDTGGTMSPSLPGNVALSMKFGTGRVGRSFRGRMFIGGLPDNQITDNQANSGWADGLITSMESFRDLLNTAGYSHVIVSRQFNKLPVVPPETYEVLTYSFADLRVDTMRSRLA